MTIPTNFDDTEQHDGAVWTGRGGQGGRGRTGRTGWSDATDGADGAKWMGRDGLDGRERTGRMELSGQDGTKSGDTPHPAASTRAH